MTRLAALALLGCWGAPSYAPTPPLVPSLRPLPLQPGTPFAFGCTGPTDPDLLGNLSRWLAEELQPNERATLAWDCANGPWGGNANASASIYIKHRTPALFCGTGGRPLQAAEKAVLRRLDAAGIYNSFGIGEWGSTFHCLTPAEDPGADRGCGAWEHGWLHPRDDCGPSGYYKSSMDCSDSTANPNINCSLVNRTVLALGRNPRTKAEAYSYIREAYTRAASAAHAGYDGPGGGTHSTPGYSYFTHEPAKWGAKLTGFEVAENIENSQTHVAFARKTHNLSGIWAAFFPRVSAMVVRTGGGSRQRGVPWHAQVSPWHGASETSTCPGGAAVCHLGGTCQGRDAGHSLSFLRRMFIYHWLAGSALNTAECCSCYGFESEQGNPWPTRNNVTVWADTPARWARPNGEMLRDTFRLYAQHDRGSPHAPLAIVIDAHAGYGGSICSPRNRQQWGTFVHTAETQSVYDLLTLQLLSCAPDCQYPHINANLTRGETMQLRSTPFGEIADVLQSDAPASVLAMYPAVLLAGEIEWTSRRDEGEDLATALGDAARLPGSKLRTVLMRRFHQAELGPAAVAALETALSKCEGSCAVEVLEEWVNPETKRTAAISNARLATLAAELNLVNVTAEPFGIQWLTNTLTDGDVLVYVANNRGVAKPPCSAAVLDPNRTTVATVTPTTFAYSGVKELLGLGVRFTHGSGGAAAVRLTLGPGDAALLRFSAGGSRSAHATLKTDDDAHRNLTVPAHIKIMTAVGYSAANQSGWSSFGKSFKLADLLDGHQ